MKDTQNMKILRFMKEHGWITPMDALSLFGCMRLSARIGDLKKMGYNIERQMAEGRNMDGEIVHFAKYRLLEAA